MSTKALDRLPTGTLTSCLRDGIRPHLHLSIWFTSTSVLFRIVNVRRPDEAGLGFGTGRA